MCTIHHGSAVAISGFADPASVGAIPAYIWAKTVIYFDPIGEPTEVVANAHPDFVAAVRTRG
ncbi:hypothetical protein [Nocardia thraciensis]